MPKHKALHIDIETRSNADLKKVGVYRYVEDPFFKIQLFSYAFDDDEVKRIDLEQGEKIPRKVIRAIQNPKIEKWAHNAQFERVCLSRHIFGEFGKFLDPTKWRDTAVYGATIGLPRDLDSMSRALGKGETKDKEGKRLIRYFAMPCKPTKVNGFRTWNLPEHAPEDWELYGQYNEQDVRAEMGIHRQLIEYYPEFPEHEWEFYETDQRINDRGIPVDVEFVKAAIALKDKLRRRASFKLERLTGIGAVTQTAKLKEWAANEGYPIKSLDQNSKEDMLADPDLAEQFPQVYKMVQLLNEAGGTAVAKYDKIYDMMNNDHRLRGQIIFYGAGATGRFAGKGVQVQNLPRIYIKDPKDLERYRERVKQGKVVKFDILTQLCRTAFIARPGTEFAVSDYSQIEARVNPWYANETWALKAFKNKEDIYVATAVRMYKVDYETAKNEWRQHGKTGTLALGYGGGTNALVHMGALRDGIPESELPGLVKVWRKANPNIVKFWKQCEQAAKAVIHFNGKRTATVAGKLRFTYKPEAKLLQIWLPSGRALGYFDAHLGRKGEVRYFGGFRANGERWYKDTFGGKLVENIVQATARDLLCEALQRIEEAKKPSTLFHVHDEAIAEVPEGFPIRRLNKLMASPLPEWAEGLPLGSEGDTIKFYRKV